MDGNAIRYEVHGMTSGRGGHPLRKARVVVWWRQIRERRELAVGETGDDGGYRVCYELPGQAPRPVLIVVEALSEFLEKPLFSPVIAAQPDLQVDLHWEEKDTSEWATLTRAIHPLLGGLSLADLVEDGAHQDLSFLAQELSKDVETVMRVAVSARLEAAFKIDAAAFYAFLRQRVPAALPSPLLEASQDFTLIAALLQQIASMIFALSADVQKQALIGAIALDLIGPQYTARIPALVDQLQSLRTTDLLNQPYLVGSTTLGQLLDAVSLAPAKQAAFAKALAGSSLSMRNFWRTLGDGTHGLSAADVSSIERALSVGAFVKNDVPLMQTVLAGFADGTYRGLPDLARVGLQDWVRMVQKTGAPSGIDAAGAATPAQVFAAVIYARVTRAYPTAALSSRIAVGGFVPPQQRQPLAQFFQNNAALELVKDNLSAYLEAEGEGAFAGIDPGDRPAVIANARGMQRVLRITPNVDVAQSLLQMDLRSATQVATLGQQQFFAKATAAGLSKVEANQVYQAAAQRYARVVALFTRFNSGSLGVFPSALGQLDELTELMQQAVRRDESLATLFGSEDFCKTDDCSSVLSAAAYLCDLLLWLRNHRQAGGSALDVLSARRPDIRHLLLNCPNTDIELPYIDLVIELLADQVSPPIDGVSTQFTQEALADGTTYFYVVTAVNGKGEGPASPQVSAIPVAATVVPPAPTGLAASSGDGSVTLSWNAVAGATGYNIYFATTTGVTTANGTRIAAPDAAYPQSGLVNGTSYFYIVTAINALGEGPASTQVTASPAAATAVPAAPTGLSVTAGDTQITLSWNSVAGATRYNLYWSNSPGVTPATGTRIPGATAPFVQSALVNGTNYYYVVTAVNAVGESSASGGASAAPTPAAAPPAAPTGVTATPGDGLVTISWNPVAGATSYNIYWATSSGVTTTNGTAITGSRNPRWKQTSDDRTATELRAAPEYFNQGAFATLFGANYPFTLPYSTGLDELRACLQQWKLPLWQLRQALLPYAGATAAQNASVAAERFGMTPHGQALVTTPNLVPLSVVWNTPNPVVDLVGVPAFLQAASLTYESLLELLQVAWVQGGLNIGILGIDDTCMTSKQVLSPFGATTELAEALSPAQTSLRVVSDAGFPAPDFPIQIGAEILLVTAVSGAGNTVWAVARAQQGTAAAAATPGAPVKAPSSLDPAFLDRAHRFLRLWNATGYKMWELDLLLTSPAVANNTLDAAGLAAIFAFRQLQDATGLSVAQQLAFYQDIDVASHRNPDASSTTPLFAQVFLNSAVQSVAPDPDLAVLAGGGPVGDQSMVDHLPALQAALGSSAADAATLISLTAQVATTLAAPMALADASITVSSAAGFPAAPFFVSVLSETLLVTAMGGAGNTTWSVARSQKGSAASSADAGTTVGFYPLTLSNLSLMYRVGTLARASKLTISNLLTIAQLLRPAAGGAAAALAPLLASPSATLAFLQQLKAVQSPGLSLDALQYLTTPPASTTLVGGITAAQTTISVAGAAAFPAPNFYISIGAEVLQVTALTGPGNTTWTVARGQQGTTTAVAAANAPVALVGGWTTSTQMSQANITAALAAIQQTVQSLPTKLTASITAAQTTLTVASDAGFALPNFFVSIGAEVLLVTAVGGTNNTTWTVVRAQSGTVAAAAASGTPVMPVSASTTLTAPISATEITISVADATAFPPPDFFVSIGSEIVQVTAVGGIGNTTWTVLRGQQNTNAAAAAAGTIVVPTGANLNGSVIAAVAGNAHTAANGPLANDVSAILLNRLQVQGLGQSLLATLEDPTFTGSSAPISQASFPNQFLAIQLFDKAAVIVRALRLVATDLAWLIDNAGIYGGLEFAPLPVLPPQAALPLQPVLDTLLLVKLARKWTMAPASSPVQTLYDLIAGVGSGTLATAETAQAALANITGWPLADIQSFAGALALAYPASYTQPAAYDSLRVLEGMALTAGANAAQLSNWGSVPADETTAEAMAAGALGVLKSQQGGNDAWLALSAQLMNPIRERRSNALQAFLVGQKDSSGQPVYGDVDGLFDHFLIDTQMSSCQVTSRVVQAYIAVQVFVERCLMNLEAPAVVVDLNLDDTWSQWQWMSRYRVWQANREVFLYPENWLIESDRPNRTEIYQQLEQEVHQGQATKDYLETVVLNYIDRLDGLSHLVVTGTCEDPASGAVYVVARSEADPPVFYLRCFVNGAWSGWARIPLDIKAHQAVPAIFRGRVCLYWTELKVSNEPQQVLPVAQQSSTPPSQNAERYVAISLHFSVFRNGAWAPAQASKGKLFDKPFLDPTVATDTKAVEALYTLKVQAAPVAAGFGASLWIDIFRLGDYTVIPAVDFGIFTIPPWILMTQPGSAVHVGRAVFDGRFSDLELSNTNIVVNQTEYGLLAYAQRTYGPEAQPLLPLVAPDPDIVGEPGLVPFAGSLATSPANAGGGSSQAIPLAFTSVSALEQNVGPLLSAAQVPFRVVGPDSDLNFDPASYFFFQDNRRCYWVESQKNYWTGSTWSPVTPSNPASAPFEVRYAFHPFYHPFTRLFWHQLAGGGFDALYDPNLQQNPDQVDPSGSDVFAFAPNYQPTWRVRWDHDDVTGTDRQFLDFGRGSAYSVYHWELFYHVPVYLAQLLSQNQQFEDAQNWFHYVFNPTRQGSDPVPQRFWIPKPLHNLTAAQILGQQINVLLAAVNQGDPTADAEVAAWRADPFNPFLLADMRLGVPYMKATVMSYLDNVVAWADNLFSSASREALSEATLLYVIASEILGPTPTAVPPPQHADESFDQLAPALDAFANAMVEIENVVGGAGAVGGTSGSNGTIPVPQTFYFKIPPNQKLLGYWGTVADRLFKMRHCQSITGAPLSLALFDAPIDPGLLVRAQAAGMDLSSVLSSMFAPLPNYRFTALYPVALDFVNAVRAYGALLLAALEKSDADQLAVLLATNQQQLLADADQIFQWQVDQAQNAIDALNLNLQLGQQRASYDLQQSLNYPNTAEGIGISLSSAALTLNYSIATAYGIAAGAHLVPFFTFGASGFGGSPQANGGTGGKTFGDSFEAGAQAAKAITDAIDKTAALCNTIGKYAHSADDFFEKWKEQQIDTAHTQKQIDGAQIALQIAQQNQANHQNQEQQLQQQIDFLTQKFTNKDLYDWMVGTLSTTYFQSYQLAYQMCKQVERCFQFELGDTASTFIQFGYWDSLHKGLFAGETLNHDLRRMQSAYLQENARRFELSRFVSLDQLPPAGAPWLSPLQQLLVTGACDFDLAESLFDSDYPGHYNRRLTRVSVTVVYPSPGKFDNVKATLTMVANKVRVSTDLGAGYPEAMPGPDPRFVYNYAAVPQKIALGNAQDDPGLFVTAIANNIVDQRYLPFENAGALSSWHLEMPAITNEVDLSTVGDVVLHLYYTALDGGRALQQAVQADNLANQPTAGLKVFSAQNDFAAQSPPTVDNPYPLTPWQAFLGTQKAIINALPIQQDGTPRWQAFNNPPSAGGANTDQVLTLKIQPSKFPAWTRGKTISVTSITVLTASWPPGTFTLAPQAPLPAALLPMNPIAGVTEPNVCSATIVTPANTPLGTWSFKIQPTGAADFRSLTAATIGDVLLLVNYVVA